MKVHALCLLILLSATTRMDAQTGSKPVHDNSALTAVTAEEF